MTDDNFQDKPSNRSVQTQLEAVGAVTSNSRPGICDNAQPDDNDNHKVSQEEKAADKGKASENEQLITGYFLEKFTITKPDASPEKSSEHSYDASCEGSPRERQERLPVEVSRDGTANEVANISAEEMVVVPAEERAHIRAEEKADVLDEQKNDTPTEERDHVQVEEKVDTPARGQTDSPTEKKDEVPTEESTGASAEQKTDAPPEQTTHFQGGHPRGLLGYFPPDFFDSIPNEPPVDFSLDVPVRRRPRPPSRIPTDLPPGFPPYDPADYPVDELISIPIQFYGPLTDEKSIDEDFEKEAAAFPDDEEITGSGALPKTAAEVRAGRYFRSIRRPVRQDLFPFHVPGELPRFEEVIIPPLEDFSPYMHLFTDNRRTEQIQPQTTEPKRDRNDEDGESESCDLEEDDSDSYAFR